jgi:hypothetical protein
MFSSAQAVSRDSVPTTWQAMRRGRLLPRAAPIIITAAKATPACGTPVGERHDEQRQRTGDRPGHEADHGVFAAMRMPGPAKRLPQHPQADQTEQAPAEIFQQGRPADAALGHGHQRQGEQRGQNGHRHMREEQRNRHHQGAREGGGRSVTKAIASTPRFR